MQITHSPIRNKEFWQILNIIESQFSISKFPDNTKTILSGYMHDWITLKYIFELNPKLNILNTMEKQSCFILKQKAEKFKKIKLKNNTSDYIDLQKSKEYKIVDCDRQFIIFTLYETMVDSITNTGIKEGKIYKETETNYKAVFMLSSPDDTYFRYEINTVLHTEHIKAYLKENYNNLDLDVFEKNITLILNS